MILGCDPSQRHTGLCLLGGASPIFHETRTIEPDVLSSIRSLKADLSYFLEANRGTVEAYAIEKQLSAGARSSALLFHVQMTILDLIVRDGSTPTLIMPLPVQLTYYIKKRHDFDGTTASELVHHFKRRTGFEGRISQHCVDAYYVARLARDVLDGKWRYNLPSREVPLTPFGVQNGDDQGTQSQDREAV